MVSQHHFAKAEEQLLEFVSLALIERCLSQDNILLQDASFLEIGQNSQ